MLKDLVIIIIYSLILIKNAEFSSLCGYRFTNRIVGGSDTVENSWPWTVSLNYNFVHICGGTLINNQWVLTAAHCFPNVVTSAYKIVLGTNNISNYAINGTRSQVSKIVIHENYAAKQSFDIALDPILFSQKIFPACLPSSVDSFEGERCTFVGWGRTYPNGPVQDTLRELSQNVLTESECGVYVKQNLNQKYCTGYEGSPEDTCQGDSGAGMMCVKSDGKWYVSGIVSYGFGSCNHVSVNARVDFFRNWIDKVINSN